MKYLLGSRSSASRPGNRNGGDNRSKNRPHRRLVRRTFWALLAGLLVTSALPAGIAHATPQTQTLNYTGAAQDFVVPAGVTEVLIECWGAAGGIGWGTAGLGGHTRGRYSVTPGETLKVYVGGQGTSDGSATPGFNGGGRTIDGGDGGTGGGASDIRQGGNALANRIIVAGGGGGGGFSVSGGAGGGVVGGSGVGDAGGGGGTQIAGGGGGIGSGTGSGDSGSSGQGGDSHGSVQGAGGGGFYGGGGGGGLILYGGGGGGSGFIGTSTSEDTLTENGVRSGNGLVTIAWGDLPNPIDLLTGFLPGEPIGYPSDDCTGPTVFDGYINGGYLKLQTGSSGDATWICVAADDGTSHFGGKVSIDGSIPDPPIDNNDEECDTNSTSRVVNGDGFVGPIDFDIDLNVAPNETDAAWVCMEAINTLDNSTILEKRLVISTSTPSGTGFQQDISDPHPIVGSYVERPNPGSQSAACQLATSGKTRLINADIGTAHVWLYTLSENGGTRQSLCLRAQEGTDSAGGRLVVDGGGQQTFVIKETVTPAGFGVCDIPGAGLIDVFEIRAHAGTPSYACVMILNDYSRFKVDSSGTQTFADFDQDA